MRGDEPEIADAILHNNEEFPTCVGMNHKTFRVIDLRP